MQTSISLLDTITSYSSYLYALFATTEWHYGPIKVDLEFSIPFSGFSFLGLNIYLVFNPHSNYSSNLFLSSCWLLVFGFLQGKVVNSEFWNFFSVNYCSLDQLGLDRTGHMSFLTGQDRTPKFAGQVLPDRTESRLIFLNVLPTNYRLLLFII